MRPAWPLWVSQPSVSSMAMRGPSSRARKLAAKVPRLAGSCFVTSLLAMPRVCRAVVHRASSWASLR